VQERVNSFEEASNMNIVKKILFLSISLVFAASTVGAINSYADESLAAAPVVSQNEMPLLRGNTWLKMTQDEKVAFVWGMGHIITMERERIELYPALKKESFVAKLAQGLAGVPMNEVVGAVDQYYKENPDKTAEPVIKVIWEKLVKPKLSGNDTNPPEAK
jgi:hypothetical protein